MPWKAMDVRDQRVRFVVAASLEEQPFKALCAQFGISRPTGLLWLNDHRLKAGGFGLRLKVAGLRLKPPQEFPAESRLKARWARLS